MPQSVPEPVHPPAVVGACDVAALVEVRDVDERVVPQAVQAQGGGPGLRVELTVQPLREGELLVVGEGLVPEHEHRIRVHPGPDLGQGLGVVHLTQIDRADLGDEVWMQRTELEGHGDVLLWERRERPAGTRGGRQNRRAPVCALGRRIHGDRSIAGSAPSRRRGPDRSRAALSRPGIRAYRPAPATVSSRNHRSSSRDRPASRAPSASRPDLASCQERAGCRRREDGEWLGTTI